MKNISIIGGGLGGLTSAALLAKSGYKVTLLEQHNIVGGSATTFKRRGGFTVEVGLHEMDDVYDGGIKEEIFKSLGVYDHVEFIKVDELFRIKTAKSDIILPDGVESVKESLKNRFPKENASIDRYFTLMRRISEDFVKLSDIKWWQMPLFPLIFRSILRYRKKAVREVLDDLFSNEELKLILISNIQYYHDKADDFSFLYHCVAQYGYYKGGGWYIKGGSQVLSDYLASVITQHGGEVITKANVVEILHDKSEVRGVKYEKKSKLFELKADIVISNASMMDTYKMADITYKQTREVGISLLTLYLGFSKNIKEVYGKKSYSNFYHRGASSIDEYNKNIDEGLLTRTAVFVDYSQIDAGLTDASKSLGVVCCVDDMKYWENLDEDAYKAKKDALAKDYIALLEEEYPGISDLVEYSEVATAKTVKRYLKTPSGTAYGFAPTAKQFFRIPEIKSKKLKNLYFVGAWVIGGGFTPAILSGGMVAREIKADK